MLQVSCAIETKKRLTFVNLFVLIFVTRFICIVKFIDNSNQCSIRLASAGTIPILGQGKHFAFEGDHAQLLPLFFSGVESTSTDGLTLLQQAYFGSSISSGGATFPPGGAPTFAPSGSPTESSSNANSPTASPTVENMLPTACMNVDRVPTRVKVGIFTRTEQHLAHSPAYETPYSSQIQLWLN